MNRIGKILTHITLAAVIMSSGSAYVYADELKVSDDTGIILEETADIKEPVMEDTAEDIPKEVSADEPALNGAASVQITAIDPPEQTEYSFGYKYSLPRLLENLPSSLTVWHEDERDTIDIAWKCRDDYADDLDTYVFIPDLEGYSLAQDLEVPDITVSFEGDRPAYPDGSPRMDTGSSPYIPIMKTEGLGSSAAAKPYYNVYEQGKLPPVRNQSPYSTCWAFGTIACMEADLIHDGTETRNVDLSELHMAYYGGNYTDPKGLRKDTVENYGPVSWLDNGGWIVTGKNLLTNLTGAVKETVAPYGQALNIESKLKDKSYAVSKDSYQVDRMYYYNVADRDGIKEAITEHGAVIAGFTVNNYRQYYNPAYNSYYNPYSQNGGGHFITLVGWDDNFSGSRFYYTPQGDGAWLVRNSWGYDGYDLDGYFWISYYDWGLLNWSSCMMAFDTVKASYKNCYAYDGFGCWDWIFEVPSPAIENTSFVVSKGEAVKAVGIDVISGGGLTSGITAGTVSAEVTVKNTKTGKTSVGSINCPRSGFYTVKLKEPLEVPQKATVEVTVKYTSPSGKVTIVAEPLESGDFGFKRLHYNTVLDKGFTLNGSVKNNDPRVKLYTVNSKAPKNIKVTKVSLNKTKKTLKKGKTFTLKATVKPSDATNKKLKWTTSNKKVATVTQKGVVKAIKAGKATITATATDGSKKKAKCKITVKKK